MEMMEYKDQLTITEEMIHILPVLEKTPTGSDIKL